MELAVIALLKAKAGKRAELERALRNLVETTRSEDGCLAYDLHGDNEDPDHFVFIERWSSEPLWQAHMEAPHMQAFQARTEDLVANWALHQLSKIS